MDALELNHEDHETLKGLFAAYGAARDDGARRGIVEQVMAMLEVHTEIEEDVMYPAIREAGGDDLEEVVEHGSEEHVRIASLMGELRTTDVGRSGFDATWSKFQEEVLHHAEEEETKIHPLAKRALPPDRLQLLGEEMAARKPELEEKVARQEKLPHKRSI